ncbi:MAG: hypothetical protein DRH08_04305 [Deltaproteobacteria bacterium]|nr:MAG: hypothetical protein DRH08_04305 [Deltaproteobacteria bacterium]
MGNIYTNIVSLVNDAVADTQSAAAEFEYAPPAITIPAVPFTASIGGTIPAAPTANPPIVDLDYTFTGSVDRASYRAVSSALGALSVGSLPSSLDYVTPVHPDALPAVSPPDGVGTAPEAGFLEILDNASLTPVSAPVITVGDRVTLQAIPELNYEEYGFDKLTQGVPPVVSVPSVEELSTPEKLVVQVEPELLTAIAHTLSGQDIMDIQPELYLLATEDVRRERYDTERKLFADSAAKGFDDSNGALFEGLADLNFAFRLKEEEAYEAGRDELFEAAKKTLVTAIQQSIALETANFAVHLSYASKLIEVFEINYSLHTAVFDVVVDMYTAQLAGVNALIQSYNTYIATILAEQSAKAAEVQQYQAQVRTDQAEISMYEAQISTTEAQTDVYSTSIDQETLKAQEFSAYISGLMKNVDIVKLNIGAYKEALRVYSDATKADSAIIDAYGAQVRAEGSAVGVYTENWDLYATANSALSGQNNAVRSFNSASLAAVRSEIGVFRQAATEQRSYLSAVGAWTSANNAIASDYERGVTAVSRFYAGKNATVVDIAEATSRLELSQASLAATESALDAQREAAQAVIDAGLAASEATTYAGQAQAAYAIRSVSTQLGASATDSDKQSFTSSASEGRKYSRSYSYTKSANIAV